MPTQFSKRGRAWREAMAGMVAGAFLLYIHGFAPQGQAAARLEMPPFSPVTPLRTNKSSATTTQATDLDVIVLVKTNPPTSAPSPAQGTKPQETAPPGTKARTPKPVRLEAVKEPECTTNTVVPGEYPRSVTNVFEAQVALARQAYSPGSIDGLMGAQTSAALKCFQVHSGLPETGAVDKATREKLQLASAPLTTYVVTTNDLGCLQPLGTNWLGKSQQSTLAYETILELVSEKCCTNPKLVRKLNPRVNWTNLVSGQSLVIPDVKPPETAAKASVIQIFLAEKVLHALDSQTNLLAHFPCSIASRMEKRPVGELRVKAIAPNPNYTFDPELFSESPEARQIKTKLVLQPGPNNPVGVAWIGLDRPGYGIHGTPSPEQVGRTESHGCFRLANWNAELLMKMVTMETVVIVEP